MGSQRDECLNGELLHSVLEARVVIEEGDDLHNNVRQHRALGMKTPAASGKMMRKAPDDENSEGAR